MKTTDEMTREMEQALAHHKREVERLEKMIAAAKGLPAPTPQPHCPHVHVAPLPYVLPHARCTCLDPWWGIGMAPPCPVHGWCRTGTVTVTTTTAPKIPDTIYVGGGTSGAGIIGTGTTFLAAGGDFGASLTEALRVYATEAGQAS